MTNQRKYYIIVDGDRHEGPLSFDEIIVHPRFSPTAPVWRDGLADWAQAQLIADFADYFASLQPNVPQQPVNPVAPPPGYNLHQPQPQNFGGNPTSPMPEWWYADNRRERKMPSTYLAFAIIVTICCCIPTGIVAIIYSSKVSQAFYRGEYDRAENLSHNALLWCLISLLLGLMCMPLTGLIQYATML
ncbi:MAG: CD225/dispanin family protein [Duncaniella sp.]|nr:CD225/dispanin family protein [Duncaniella sp.]